MTSTKVGFFCQLPPRTVAEIRRRAKCSGVPQWRVLDDALMSRTFSIRGRKITVATGGPRRKARGARG